MKRKLSACFITMFLISVVTSCTTIPGPIDSKYLIEKTDTESKKIEELEAAVISRHKVKISAEQSLKDAGPVVKKLENEIELLEKEKKILKDQYELYMDNKDAVNAEKKKEQITDNGNRLSKKKAELAYSSADLKLKEKVSDLRTAELALAVAELNYYKSRIAESYRERTEPVKNEKSRFEFMDKLMGKDKDDPYGYKKYKTFLDKQKKDVVKAEKEQKKAEVDLKAAEKELSGFKQ